MFPFIRTKLKHQLSQQSAYAINPRIHLASFSTHASTKDTFPKVFITPPNLTTSHLGERILCHRPMRKGSPAMMINTIENKLVAHNYGHGGSGWTLGPGAATYVTSLLEKTMQDTGLTLRTPVTILGAGAVGSFCALKMVERGFTDITLQAEQFDSLTSHNAGGLLAPVSMDNDPEMQKRIDQIGIDAYRFYQAIALQKHAILKQGAIIVPTYFETREESGLEPYVGKVMQPAKEVMLDFQNGTTRKMVAYEDGIFMDTSSLMTSLKNTLRNKVKFKQEKSLSIAAIQSKIVVNCTGIGARELVQDNKMVSVQGHLIMLKDQNPADVNHMILVYFNKEKTKAGFDVKRSLYMFPKRVANSATRDVGVLGGTFIEGADANTPHLEEFNILLQNAKRFYGIHDASLTTNPPPLRTPLTFSTATQGRVVVGGSPVCLSLFRNSYCRCC